MSDTFDWFDLLIDVICKRIEEGDPAAAAYLRTRIEAAFVPRKQPLHCETCGTGVAEVLCAKCGEWWRDNSPEVHEATARAEAAEARNKALEEALSVCADAPLSGWTIAQGYARAALGAEHGK